MKLPIKYKNKFVNVNYFIKPVRSCDECTKLECFSVINLLIKFIDILEFKSGKEYLIRYFGWYVINHINKIIGNYITEMMILDKLIDLYEQYQIDIINKWIELIFGLQFKTKNDTFIKKYDIFDDVDWNVDITNCRLKIKYHTKQSDVLDKINTTIELLLDFEKKSELDECILMASSKLIRFINYWYDYVDIYSFDKYTNVIKIAQLPESTIKFIGESSFSNLNKLDDDGNYIQDMRSLNLFCKTGYYTINDYVNSDKLLFKSIIDQVIDFEMLKSLMNKQLKLKWFNNDCLDQLIEHKITIYCRHY